VNVLVDTSVWSLALRRRAQQLSPAEQVLVGELKELIEEGRARLLGLVRQELLSGIKSAAQFERLRNALRAYPDEPLQTADHETAAETSNQCRGKGIVVSVVDALICAIALRRDWSIFSSDPDFHRFSRVIPIRLHAARGNQ
jgi:predicted nucleic acid-binding protein